MNRGVVQSSPVQQMMAAGNPNWWNINHTMRPPLSHQQPSSSPNFFSNNNNTNFVPPYPYPYPYSYPYPYPPTNSSLPFPPNQELPESWSQLLMGEEEKKMGNWEEQMLISEVQNGGLVEVKQESSSVNSYMYGHNNNNSKNNNEEFQAAKQQTAANWSHHHHHQIVPPPAAASSSSPKSCVTSFSSNMLDFSTNNTDAAPPRHHPPPDRSSECNSNGGGGAVKKARVQQSTTQSSSTFKVRKEKLGDRITALHQLVSPFGKTDTASVLLEAIGYIRFLQNQIEALSLPYLGGGSPNIRQQHSVQGEKNCLFPEDPGQLLNESCLKRKATSEQDSQELLEVKKDLRSRGLCLVPVSCTLQVGSENGADYWAPALGGAAAGFR